VKKLWAILLLTVACAPAVRTSNAPLTGSAAPQLAVEQFLNAVHAQDIQAMGSIFGTAQGPARDQLERNEFERRMIIMQCYFNYDHFRIRGESTQDGRRVFQVELTRGTKVRNTSAQTVQGPGGRWYVESMDIAAVRDFCAGS
jgi:hypothetical protein